MELAERIHHLRGKLGYSFDKLSELSGVSKTYLYQLEKGVTKKPSAKILMKIASALQTTFTDLLGHSTLVNSSDFSDIPKPLSELVDKHGERLDIRKEDVDMLANIVYRGKRPKTSDEYEYLLLTIRLVILKG